MRDAIRGCLILSLLLGGAWLAFGQTAPPPASAPKNLQDEYLKEMKEVSPKLYTLETRLSALRGKIQRIIRSYADDKIGKEEAKTQLLPLMTKETRIRNAPEYKLEQTHCEPRT